MEYDKEMHLPQQVETLFQLKAGGDIENFIEVLESIKQIMRNRTDFIDGLETDGKTKEEKRKELLVETKKTILKSLEDKDLMIGLSQVEQILAASKSQFEQILRNYMNDVMTTCMSYNGSSEEETVE